MARNDQMRLRCSFCGKTQDQVDKLISGMNDTFICERIVENAPLMLSNLIHDNGDPVNYICGKRGGVKYQVITKS